MILYAFLVAAPLHFAAWLHPMHVSVTEIEMDEKEKRLEIMMRVFVDDLELTERMPEAIHLDPRHRSRRVAAPGAGARAALLRPGTPINRLRLRYGSLGSRSHAPSARITAQVLRVSARWCFQRRYLSPLAREHPCSSTQVYENEHEGR